MATVTFLFSQSVSLGGTKFFDWSNTANWSDGAIPDATSDVVIAPPSNGGVPLDDIASLTIRSVNFVSGAQALEIGTGDDLTVSNAVGNGVIRLEANAELLEPRSGLSYVTLAGNNSLVEQGGVPRGYITFSTDPSDTGSLYIHTPQPPTAGAPGVDPQVIQSFGAGDNIYIEEAESGPLTVTYTPPATGVNGTLLITEGGTPIYRFSNFRGDTALNYQAVETTVTDPLTGLPVAAIDVFVCFARGTHIRTPSGERRVETLREGELVLVADAGEARAKRVRWVGQRRLDLEAHPRPELAAPIRFRAGALGEGLPVRDLVVSPDHALLIDGRLVRAKLLINGMSIVQERGRAAVSYYHVELDDHAILLAEGVPAESYLDTGNRGFFANSGLPLVLHPDLMADVPEAPSCAPHACSAAEVEPIWRALANRARAMGFVALQRTVSVDPDLRLMVDGAVVRPHAHANGRYCFAVPPGTSELRLVSRNFLPADMRPYADDWRRLGVAVAGILWRAGSETRAIAVDQQALARGWHVPEHAGTAVWRWTDGDATIPVECHDGGVLEVRLQATGEYPIETAALVRQAA